MPDHLPCHSATKSIAWSKPAGMISTQHSFSQTRIWDKRMVQTTGEECEEDRESNASASSWPLLNDHKHHISSCNWRAQAWMRVYSHGCLTLFTHDQLINRLWGVASRSAGIPCLLNWVRGWKNWSGQNQTSRTTGASPVYTCRWYFLGTSYWRSTADI